MIHPCRDERHLCLAAGVCVRFRLCAGRATSAPDSGSLPFCHSEIPPPRPSAASDPLTDSLAVSASFLITHPLLPNLTAPLSSYQPKPSLSHPSRPFPPSIHPPSPSSATLTVLSAHARNLLIVGARFHSLSRRMCGLFLHTHALSSFQQVILIPSPLRQRAPLAG